VSQRTVGRIALLTVVALGLSLASDAGAEPAAGVLAANGQITYYDGTSAIFAAVADGSRRIIANGARSAPAWSPDGSRYVYVTAEDRLVSRRADGSDPEFITDPGDQARDPVWLLGSIVVYAQSGGGLRYNSADGYPQRLPLYPPAGAVDTEPTASVGGTLVFTRTSSGVSDLYQLPAGQTEPQLLISNGRSPSFAPDGTRVAFVRTDPASQLDQVWILDVESHAVAQLTGEATGAGNPAWSPDGSRVLFLRGGGGVRPLATVDVTTQQVQPVANQMGVDTAWQPVERNTVARVWGQDHIDTGIAASQVNWASRDDPGSFLPSAGAVVLSRDDTFLDALVGSAFAIRQSAPLLVTGRAALDPRVEREIRRILAPSGTVYLLGGELALSREVQDRVAALGYHVERIAGATHFDTAIAINRRITSSPRNVIVATGVNYYDALAAGAAAGSTTDTVIVLTDGEVMPASSAAYLNELVPEGPAGPGTAIVTVGGPGDRALESARQSGQLPSWPRMIFGESLIGANEKDTALQVARFFFRSPGIAALATNRSWFDALTGGAMIGFMQGPLLITEPDQLYPGVRAYLSRNSGGLQTAVMLGGPVALPDTLISPTGEAISLPNQWDYVSHTPESPTPRIAAESDRNTRNPAWLKPIR
jgi:hypothetical protein